MFHALMYWMEENEIDPASLKETNDLLAVVRFKLVTIDYLYNVMRTHPIATKMPNFNEFYHGGLTYHALPSEQKKLFKEKPVLRKNTSETIIQYTFAVKKEDYETVLANGSDLNSETFWACGYKINVGINPSTSEHPYMIVHNLKEESYVPLKHTIFVGSETSYYTWQQKVFSRKSCRGSSGDRDRNSYTKIRFENEINMLNVAVAPRDKQY